MTPVSLFGSETVEVPLEIFVMLPEISNPLL